MQIRVYVGNHVCLVGQLDGEARGSIHDAIENFVAGLVQAPDNFLVDFGADGFFYVSQQDGLPLSEQLQRYLYDNGPWPIHPMQPGLLYFREQVTIQFYYADQN